MNAVKSAGSDNASGNHNSLAFFSWPIDLGIRPGHNTDIPRRAWLVFDNWSFHTSYTVDIGVFGVFGVIRTI